MTGQILRASLATYYVGDYLGEPGFVTAFLTAGMVASIHGCAVAEVSLATVSRVMNGNVRGSEKTREKTREKVLHAMKELDY